MTPTITRALVQLTYNVPALRIVAHVYARPDDEDPDDEADYLGERAALLKRDFLRWAGSLDAESLARLDRLILAYVQDWPDESEKWFDAYVEHCARTESLLRGALVLVGDAERWMHKHKGGGR